MNQAILIFVKDKRIDAIRKKYHPDYKEQRAHITLVYPFENIKREEINKHIIEAIKGITQFDITLEGISKSAKGYYLYLDIKSGKSKLIGLYMRLNNGILKDYKNPDMPKYIPHITLGIFESKAEIDEAMKQMKSPNISIKIDKISLVTLNKSKIKKIENIQLK